MSDKDTLVALAERCEAATGPDWSLDSHIAKAAGYYVPSMPTGGGTVMPSGALPRFTASIDAALTLVPEGWRKFIRDSDEWRCICELEAPDDQEVGVQAATWPRAICAAALRARAKEQGK